MQTTKPKLSKTLHKSLLFFLIIFFGCDDKKETSLSFVSLSNIKNNDIVYEVVQISCEIESEETKLKTLLWVNDVKTETESIKPPFDLFWDTNSLEDGTYNIKISLVVNDNKEVFSDAINVEINNTLAVPLPSQINDIENRNGELYISWNRSAAEDFQSYKLEKGIDSLYNHFEIVKESESISDTSYSDVAWDKLQTQYYRLTTIDTFYYQAESEIVAYEKDLIPSSSEIYAVDYDTVELTIKWSQSKEEDFLSYSLLSSQSLSSDKELIETFYVITDTFFVLNDFNPNYLNWYWIEVRDTLGQSVLSSPVTYSINSAPEKVNVSFVDYDLYGMTINWIPSNAADFISYEILRSFNQFSDYSTVFSVYDKNISTYTIDSFDPTIENWFKIRVNDFWGLNSVSDPVSNQIDSVPEKPEILSITYDTTEMIVEWSLFEENDFYSYEIYSSENDTNNFILKSTIGDLNTNSFMTQIFDPTIQNWFKIKVTDYWGLSVFSNKVSNIIDSSPSESDLDMISYENGQLIFSWNSNNESDFKSYQLYQSSSEDFSDSLLVESFNERSDTSFHLNIGNGILNYYKIQVKDFWGQSSISQSVQGSSYINFIQFYSGLEVDYGNSVLETSEKDYMICGTTSSEGSGSTDILIMKTDSLGIQQWSRTYGGVSSDYGNQIIEDMNGGFIFIGTTQSYGSGLSNILVSKIDDSGNEEWLYTYGGSDMENGSSICQSTDGSYLIAGYTKSFGQGQKDIYIMKIDYEGNEIWSQTYGTNVNEYAVSIITAIDGGFYVLTNNEKVDTENIYDIALMKISSNGSLDWDQGFGGINNDLGYSIEDSGDGIIICGTTTSFGNGLTDAYIIKIGYSGGIIWEQTFGENLIEKAFSIVKSEDEGFVFVGSQESSNSSTGYDIWLTKINDLGLLEWTRNFSDSGSQQGYDISLTSDGGFVLTGDWSGDVFMIKTDRVGNANHN